MSHPKFSSGWDPSQSIKICLSLTRFLFGVGSVTPLPDFSSGWDLSHLHINNGIYVGTMVYVRAKNMLSMPQVFEQSLFLFFFFWGGEEDDVWA